MPGSVPIAHAMRGGVIDNVHRGSMAIVALDGSVLASVGDPGKVAYIRSAGKPLQALTLLEPGGAERFGLTPAEIAIICSSHSGGDPQVTAVRSVLRKAGVPDDALRSGAGIRDNCSGKHAAMLVLAVHLGADPGSYLDPDHPAQSLIIERTCEFAGVRRRDAELGVERRRPLLPIRQSGRAPVLPPVSRASSGRWPRVPRCSARRTVSTRFSWPPWASG